MNKISFLLGAGFSVPANYPTRNEINQRLKSIRQDEIYIHSDGRAFFLNGQKDPNAHWQNTTERYFAQEFLKFYNYNEKQGGYFDYEEFYDFYIGLAKGKIKSAEFESLCHKIRQEAGEAVENGKLISDFNNTFNQLLASLLKNQGADLFYTQYHTFLQLLQFLCRENTVHIHTLNHDLLMEQLSNSPLIDSFATGFEELGSLFYADY